MRASGGFVHPGSFGLILPDVMIRTGYLRWEIDVQDVRSRDDEQSREVIFLARPSFRTVRIKQPRHADAAERFVRGEAAYDSVLRTARARRRRDRRADPRRRAPPVPLLGERPRRGCRATGWKSSSARRAPSPPKSCARPPRFPNWSSRAPRCGPATPGWSRGRSSASSRGRASPQPTNEDEPMRLDAANYQDGVPELVAAELVRNVVEPKEFHEFCQFDCLTVLNGDKYYRIPRRPHGLLEVWDAKTRRAVARLCVVFQDPGMPPSDEVVMKYLLAKHQPELLWKMGVRFSPPTGKFEVEPPRRWSLD